MSSKAEILEQDFCNCMDAVAAAKSGLEFAVANKLESVDSWRHRIADLMHKCTAARLAMERGREIKPPNQATMVGSIRSSLLRFDGKETVMVKVSDGHFLAVCRIVSIDKAINPEEMGYDVQIFAEVVK